MPMNICIKWVSIEKLVTLFIYKQIYFLYILLLYNDKKFQ